MSMEIEVKVLNKQLYKDGLPDYATDGSAAIDLISPETFSLRPRESKKVFTGLAIHIGSAIRSMHGLFGHYSNYQANIAALALPRSGLGSKGLVLANVVGLIDEDYQGELIVNCLYDNRDWRDCNITIHEGDRFAQLMFLPIVKPVFKVVDEFTDSTDRGTGGFNSTGT